MRTQAMRACVQVERIQYEYVSIQGLCKILRVWEIFANYEYEQMSEIRSMCTIELRRFTSRIPSSRIRLPFETTVRKLKHSALEK